MLEQLSSLLVLSRIKGNKQTEFTGLKTHSDSVQPGDLFFCLIGQHDDGHRYAADAVGRGAVALVVQHELELDVPMLIVNDGRHALAVIANHFYDYPSHAMPLIGVTGTNGKTTTTYVLDKLLSDCGHRIGLMGTIQMRIANKAYEVKHTTQESLELQSHLRKMKDVGTSYCIMEVSSHALQLGRVKGCRFRTAIFTNLSQDHLDYHKTMGQYEEAKGLFFSRMGNEFHASKHMHQYAVLNADDPVAERYAQLTTAQVITYGIENKADVRAEHINISARGTSFELITFRGTINIQLKLIGKFSVYNVLAAVTAALLEGVKLEQIQASLAEIKGVPGRFEAIEVGQPFVVIVDYAHTPDSLENVLKTIRDFAEGEVICLFGCGGDRDRSKRPIMGHIAATYSDRLIITSDNSRTEDPAQILQHIEAGVVRAGMPKDRYELIIDRQEAIETAIEKASRNDVILIAGKGHETYQEIMGQKLQFDDRVIAKNAIRGLLSD